MNGIKNMSKALKLKHLDDSNRGRGKMFHDGEKVFNNIKVDIFYSNIMKDRVTMCLKRKKKSKPIVVCLPLSHSTFIQRLTFAFAVILLLSERVENENDDKKLKMLLFSILDIYGVQSKATRRMNVSEWQNALILPFVFKIVPFIHELWLTKYAYKYTPHFGLLTFIHLCLTNMNYS